MSSHHRVLLAGLAVAAGVVPRVSCAAQSSATPGARAFEIEVASGHSLSADGRGVYRDGEAGVGAFGLFAITLCSDGRRCSTLPETAPVRSTSRTLVLDLRRAVAGSGSVPRGLLTAETANFGAFWEQDTTRRATYNGREGWAIRSALDVPIGRTVRSSRVEIRFSANGRQHILQFGPWTAGQFQPNQGAFSGDGSTQATIERPSDTTWIVRSGERSVGRLWDNSNPTRPIDLGLYEFTFEVRYRARPFLPSGRFEPDTVTCASAAGQRSECPANTSGGVALQKSTGAAPCLLGKSWGYDDTGVWVADGCSGEFIVGQKPSAQTATQPSAKKSPEYVPNAGFRIYEGDKGQIYMRLFSYSRFLNQKNLKSTYTDFFGNTISLQRREDIELNKFFLPFSGWFLSPKFRYYLYVWSANTSQGDPAQVVGAGNLSYVFSNSVTLGTGITSLPAVRSTEGQFPYWLGIDDRLTSDEFFRGSYTTGVWLKGELSPKVKYMAMLGNNLSQLGVSAAQLDNHLQTTSFMLQWLPTTGEFGLYGAFGDFEDHERVATRLAGHYTQSREDRQEQPGTNSIENSQIRLTDGSIIFTPDLFAPGITVENVRYDMTSFDAGVKYRGVALDFEHYWRKLSSFHGTNVGGIGDIYDHGWQAQFSAMVIQKTLQPYLGGSAIQGPYGNASEVRAGMNWYFRKERGLRLNGEWLRLYDCPVGYTAVPYPVGGNGNVFHLNVEMNF